MWTNRRIKLLLNSFLLFTSVLSLIFFLMIFFQSELLGKVGHAWSLRFEQSLTKEAKEALRAADDAGSQEQLIGLLESPRWRDLFRNDRGYPLKRKMLAKACQLQLESAQYELMENTARSWVSLDDRDIDAQAYLYESLRHQPDLQDEGVRGLRKLLNRFPGHLLSGLFLARHFSENGDEQSSDLTRMRVMRAAASALSRWRIYWTSTNKNLYDPKQSTFVYLESTGEQVSAEFEIPSDTTFLRIDPPTNSHFQISSMSIKTGMDTLSFNLSQMEINEMHRDGEHLISTGAIDPFFTTPIALPERATAVKPQRIRLELGLQLEFDGQYYALADFLSHSS